MIRVMCVVFLSAVIILFAFNGFMGKIGIPDYSKITLAFIFAKEGNVKSDDGRVNVLILGKAGAGNSAPDLTDTIIFTSVSGENKSIRMVSIPRDIWISEIRAKINSAYYWGNKSGEGGIGLVKTYVSHIVGQPVHYVVVVDFSGFKEVVDVLGGVDVEVENSFSDEKYPIAGKETDKCDGDTGDKQSPESEELYKCRFETISFEKGKRHMDGETALKFVRSRNAQGNEGTDLAREARQQKVISAIEKKVLSPATLINPLMSLRLWTVARKYVETDLDGPSVAVLGRKVIAARKNVKSLVIPEELLINPPKSQKFDYQYVFIPKKENWEEIHLFVNNFMTDFKNTPGEAGGTN